MEPDGCRPPEHHIWVWAANTLRAPADLVCECGRRASDGRGGDCQAPSGLCICCGFPLDEDGHHLAVSCEFMDATWAG